METTLSWFVLIIGWQINNGAKEELKQKVDQKAFMAVLVRMYLREESGQKGSNKQGSQPELPRDFGSTKVILNPEESWDVDQERHFHFSLKHRFVENRPLHEYFCIDLNMSQDSEISKECNTG